MCNVTDSKWHAATWWTNGSVERFHMIGANIMIAQRWSWVRIIGLRSVFLETWNEFRSSTSLNSHRHVRQIIVHSLFPFNWSSAHIYIFKYINPSSWYLSRFMMTQLTNLGDKMSQNMRIRLIDPHGYGLIIPYWMGQTNHPCGHSHLFLIDEEAPTGPELTQRLPRRSVSLFFE